jgi:hypothetical protein
MKNTISTILFLISSLSLTNCSLATYATSGKSEQFSGKYELSLKETEEKSIYDLRKVLSSLGFKSSSNVDQKFTKQSGKAEGFGLNSFYSNLLTFKIENRKIIIEILQTGNYKYGTEEKTNETFEKIKTEYLK